MTIVIDNFLLGVEEWTSVSDLNYFAVDVVETASGVSISTSGTYFIHDGQIVSTTHSGIPDGYTCYYTPSGVYSDGTIDLTIHAENTVSGVEEQTFHLLYGYNLRFDELIDWGPNTEVITTIKASNLAFCPNTEAESFYFETRDLYSYDLNATIVGVVKHSDLGAVIYPQNTFFFYDRTYTVTISGVRDYHGNEMEPYIFSFRVENPT
jgi:hypothetical protein